MSFEKAKQLVELATFVAGRKFGVTLNDVCERFSVSKRTSQRILHALELQFSDTTSFFDDEGRKRWCLPTGALRDLLSLNSDELAALDLAIKVMGKSAAAPEVANLEALREKILALVPRSAIARLAPDHEALLEAQGLAVRPGPVARLPEGISLTISTALKTSQCLSIKYRSAGTEVPTLRIVEPYGMLIGARRYIVAKPRNDPKKEMRYYLADRIVSAELTGETFERDQDFDINDLAKTAFGTFQNSSEYGDVVWKFSSDVAAHARAFVFHPSQTFESDADGSLIVKFKASGHLEMCWYLYTWGNKVEVLAPEALRAMVEMHRRDDFPALP